MLHKAGSHQPCYSKPITTLSRSNTSSLATPVLPQTVSLIGSLPYSTQHPPLDLDQSAEAFSSFVFQAAKQQDYSQRSHSSQISNMGDPRSSDGGHKASANREFEHGFDEELARQMEKNKRYSLPTGTSHSTGSATTRSDDSLMLLVNAITQQERGTGSQSQFRLPSQSSYTPHNGMSLYPPPPPTPILPPYNPSTQPPFNQSNQHLPSISQLPWPNTSHQLSTGVGARAHDTTSTSPNTAYSSRSMSHSLVPPFASLGQIQNHSASQPYSSWNNPLNQVDIAQQAQLHLQMYLHLHQQWQQQQLAKVSMLQTARVDHPGSNSPEPRPVDTKQKNQHHLPKERTPKSSGSGSNSPSCTPAELPEEEDPSTDDKRRRNTAASARFRKKKKQHTISIANRIDDLEGRMLDLAKEAEGLRRENGWLKEMVVLKGRLNVQKIRGHYTSDVGTRSDTTTEAPERAPQLKPEKEARGSQEGESSKKD